MAFRPHASVYVPRWIRLPKLTRTLRYRSGEDSEYNATKYCAYSYKPELAATRVKELNE